MRIVAVLFAVSLGLLYAAGCIDRKGAVPGNAAVVEASPNAVAAVLRDLGAAPADSIVSEAMRPFFAVGLGFIVLGGLAFCFGGRGTGLTLMAVGALATAAGVLFTQYPWMVLALALVAGVAALVAVHGSWRARQSLRDKTEELARADAAMEVIAEKIQTVRGGDRIKAGIKAAGPDAVNTVRQVVGPIKDRLMREGRIKPV